MVSSLCLSNDGKILISGDDDRDDDGVVVMVWI
jgi:hypothetical protein